MDEVEGASSGIRVSLLGYPSVRRGNKEIPLPSVKGRGLLAYLLLHAGEVLMREDLARWFWPRQDAFRARQSLRQALYRLRRALGDVGPWRLTQETVQWDPRGRLWVDAWAFAARAREAARHVHRPYGACPCCRRRYEDMLALYRGEFLRGWRLGDAPRFVRWVREQRAWFRGWALRGVRELVRYYASVGDDERVEAWCRTWLRWDRWNEAAYGYLMRALARQGRRGAALQVYRAYEAMVRDELDAEPAEEVRRWLLDLQQGLLAPRAAVRCPFLPPAAFPLFGREGERDQALDLLADPRTRLVALTGPGGVGKTRLAQEVAWEARSLFPDGVYWIPLEGVRDAPTLGQALQRPWAFWREGGLTLTDALRRWRTRRMLLVLDHVEAAAEDVVRWIQDLLHCTEEVALLVTAREPLRLARERVVPLEGLAYPTSEDEALTPAQALGFPAVAMLVEGIRRAFPGFVLDARRLPAVLAMTREARGMPGALERLAGQAARVLEQDGARGLEATVWEEDMFLHDPSLSHVS